MSNNLVNNKLLKEYDLLNGISEGTINLIAEKLQILNVSKDEIIIKEGDEGNAMVFLFSGRVSISQAMTLPTDNSEEDTREKEVFNTTAESRPIFGEIGIFGRNDKRTANIKAVTKCKIGLLYRDDFFSICEQNTQSGYKILRNIAHILSGRITDSNRNMMKLTTALSLIIDK